MPPVILPKMPTLPFPPEHEVQSLTVKPSRLLLLPLEVRVMVYELLLTSDADIFIPSDHLRPDRTLRRKMTNRAMSARESIYRTSCDTRRGPDVPFICELPQNVPCHHQAATSSLLHPSHYRNIIETAILTTCHQVNAEASPILYQGNSFHFEDPCIASTFRWDSNAAHADRISSFHIVLNPHYFNSSPSIRDRLFGPNHCYDEWGSYLDEGLIPNLCFDYQCLKNLTLTFGRDMEKATRPELSPLIKSWSFALRNRLRWVQIIGLNDETLLSHFFSLVVPDVAFQAFQGSSNSILHGDVVIDHRRGLTDDGEDRVDQSIKRAADALKDGIKRVRMHVSEYAARPGWKNATIWWGTSTDPPCKIRPFEGDPRWIRSLHRVENPVSGPFWTVDETLDISCLSNFF